MASVRSAANPAKSEYLSSEQSAVGPFTEKFPELKPSQKHSIIRAIGLIWHASNWAPSDDHSM